MNAGPTIALLINTYEQPDYLRRVLAAVARQTRLPEQVLLSDDGSGPETRSVFAAWSSGQRFQCEHVWQKHQGFRRARVLNQTIAKAGAEFLVFLDGDTVPHPRFVEDHQRLAIRGTFTQGHRALIGERAANRFGRNEFKADRRAAFCRAQLSGLKHAFRWPRPWRSFRRDLRGIRGCNLGIWRDDLVLVNGYNEAFEGWGREDSELAVRLMNSDRRRLDVRGWALCYHLWHPPVSRTALPRNDQLLEEALNSRIQRCKLGLDQYLPPRHAA